MPVLCDIPDNPMIRISGIKARRFYLFDRDPRKGVMQVFDTYEQTMKKTKRQNQ